MLSAVVRFELADDVATITLDSPENRNALSTPVVDGINEALDECEAAAVRVIVLTHAGPVFCAGADLKERSRGPVDSTGMVNAMRRLHEARQPTIAALRGAARAGGVGLMASCDMVVVAPTVDFAFTEVRLGLVPAIISVPVLRRVNPAHLAAPFLTGEPFGAEHARAIGLVSHVSDNVDATVEQLITGVLRSEPTAVADTKRLLRYIPAIPDDEAFAEMQQLSEDRFQSPEAAEGMASFRERRPPAWALR